MPAYVLTTNVTVFNCHPTSTDNLLSLLVECKISHRQSLRGSRLDCMLGLDFETSSSTGWDITVGADPADMP